MVCPECGSEITTRIGWLITCCVCGFVWIDYGGGDVMGHLYYVGRTNIFKPFSFERWFREDAKGIYVSVFGHTIGWREENIDYLLNAVLEA